MKLGRIAFAKLPKFFNLTNKKLKAKKKTKNSRLSSFVSRLFFNLNCPISANNSVVAQKNSQRAFEQLFAHI